MLQHHVIVECILLEHGRQLVEASFASSMRAFRESASFLGPYYFAVTSSESTSRSEANTKNVDLNLLFSEFLTSRSIRQYEFVTTLWRSERLRRTALLHD